MSNDKNGGFGSTTKKNGSEVAENEPKSSG